jgi:phosphate butyryltransferase
MKNFKELIGIAKNKAPKQCVVVCAEDKTVLEGIKMAQELGLIEPVLVGKKERILHCAEQANVDLKHSVIEDSPNDSEALKRSIALVKEQGDFLMKGMLSTSAFLKGVLNKEWGLRTGKILSHIAVLEIPDYHKLIFMSDGGMNPKLDLKIRIQIIENAIDTLRALGIQQPKVGLICRKLLMPQK